MSASASDMHEDLHYRPRYAKRHASTLKDSSASRPVDRVKKVVVFNEDANRVHETASEFDYSADAADPTDANGLSEKDEPKKRNPMKTKFMLLGAVALLALAGLVYWRMRGTAKTTEKQSTKNKRIRWADEEGYPLTEEEYLEGEAEREQRAYLMNQNQQFLQQEERMRQASAIEQTLHNLDSVRAQLERGNQEIKRARSTMDDTFGDTAAAYDETITSFEQEQSIENAFMMKTDLDSKRQNMMEYASQLQNNMKSLAAQGQALQQKYAQEQNIYRDTFGTAYTPQRTIHQQVAAQAKQHQHEQHQHHQQQQQAPQGQPSGFAIPRRDPPPGTPNHTAPIPVPPPNALRQQPIAMGR